MGDQEAQDGGLGEEPVQEAGGAVPDVVEEAVVQGRVAETGWEEAV